MSPARRLRGVIADDQRVLDSDAAMIGKIDTWLDGHRRASKQCTGGRRADSRRFVDLQPDPMAQAVAEIVGVTGLGDDLPRRAVDSLESDAGCERIPPGLLCRRHQL